MFQISTIPEGYNSGRSYFFRTQNVVSGRKIVDVMSAVVVCARASLRRKSGILLIQRNVKRFYNSTPFQSLIALLLVLNFLSNISEQQLKPLPDTPTAHLYDNLDIFFTGDQVFPLLIQSSDFCLRLQCSSPSNSASTSSPTFGGTLSRTAGTCSTLLSSRYPSCSWPCRRSPA